jgi:hypothetical protein
MMTQVVVVVTTVVSLAVMTTLVLVVDLVGFLELLFIELQVVLLKLVVSDHLDHILPREQILNTGLLELVLLPDQMLVAMADL